MRANPMDENSAILLVFRICFYIICPPLDKLICSSLLYIYVCVCVWSHALNFPDMAKIN
jgi:hypothetical protein